MRDKKLEKRVANIEKRLSMWFPSVGFMMCTAYAEHKLEDVVMAIIENLELEVSRIYPTPPEVKTVMVKKKKDAASR